MTPFDTAAAIAQANKWTAIGLELLEVMHEIIKRADLLSGAGHPRREVRECEPREEMTKAMSEAARVLSDAHTALEDDLHNWRRVLIEDSQPSCPIGDGEAEWTTHEAICAEIEAGVISVGALIKKMEMEA